MIRLAFTLSTKNPYTGKHYRSYTCDDHEAIRFISECYVPKEAKHNKWIADAFIYPNSFFGIGKTPKEAIADCIKDINSGRGKKVV